MRIFTVLIAAMWLIGCSNTQTKDDSRRWLAGDHHIHSEFSVGWTRTFPPEPIIGGDAIYAISKNAEMARSFGLEWMVTTDHGGPNHSKINLEQAYPALTASREAVPEVIQFAGLELNSPGADHSSIIVPHTHDEAERLYEYESQFDARQAWPEDESRNQEAQMLDALRFADTWPVKPVVIAHHPSRSAASLGEYGMTSPAELRNWNDAAPAVAVGMEGAPGHQAAELRRNQAEDDYPPWVYARGAYGRGYPTMGGFDQMTARVGGFWDSMLGEGRRWWITANSDSHIHYTEGGIDFWPGEYSKTYVYAQKTHDDILEGIRGGRVFVTTGDLVSELHLDVSTTQAAASIGGQLDAPAGSTVEVEIRLIDPAVPNAAGRTPVVSRVDLILGEVTGPVSDRGSDRNISARVVKRFSENDWRRDGEQLTMTWSFTPEQAVYLRVRGTNTDELEPLPDPVGEDPWTDLWFYSNPVFIRRSP